ncbi:MAG: hypothetical protein EOO46_07675 [Flavobacterium sp.]|nr:MAG: hypothetical protein EOO46_07675 [Flavobacterium sp.]
MFAILIKIKAMRVLRITFFLFINAFYANAQYDFEKYPSIEYKDYDWETVKSDDGVTHKVIVPDFYINSESLILKINYYTEEAKDSEIYISGIKYKEDIPYTPIGLSSLRIADVNGDGLKDIKIISYYMGNGLASLNVKVIYFFQQANGGFIKIAYEDKMGDNRLERDFDGDGNFEIITMKIQGHKNHNYWLFNIYNFVNGKIENVNSKENYPIMVQILNRETFKITSKLSRQEMKQYQVNNLENYNN